MKKIIVFLLVIFIVLGIAYVLVKSYIFPIKYEVYVTKYARQYNLDEKLIYSVIKAESQFDSKATSKKNAIGLMQITEDTGKWLSEEMGFNDFSRDKLYDVIEDILSMQLHHKVTLVFANGETDTGVISRFNGGDAFELRNKKGNTTYFYDNINLNHSFQTPGVIYMYLTDKQACSSIDIYNETAK